MEPKNSDHDHSCLPDHTAEQSHYITLSLRLYDLGIIPRGEFTLMETKHDPDCASLTSGSSLNCNCDCEIVLGARSYIYSDWVEPRGRS